jgi:pyruvate dehydrogenase (quinone)
MDYAGYAELLGLRGIKVERPEDVDAAWEQAFAADRPVVLDVHTDPNVPPLPAHISFDEAKGFVTTLLKGDPAETAVVRNSARAMAAQLFAKAKNAVTSDDQTR